jgi:DNA (cytosine-5)-methyltransferase 1
VTAPATKLVLSLFPGIGLLDRAFEDSGFCVVRGPDTLWGGDIRKFNPPAGHFYGVIGGPPCQNFSTVNRNRDHAAGMDLVNEFLRVCDAAVPDWALMENVSGSPVVTLPGMSAQVFTLDASHVGGDQHRLRKFHFFHKAGTRELVIPRPAQSQPGAQPTCLASEGRRKGRRSWLEFCRLQGLPQGFDLEPFTVAAKYRAVGNGVPYEMALTLARAVLSRGRAVTPLRVCACGCGAYVTGREVTASAACRKREQRIRDAARGPVTPEKELCFSDE